MIIDTEHSIKSSTFSGPNSSTPTFYWTFPASNTQPAALNDSQASDITALLSRDHPVFLSNDLPPAYDDVLDTKNTQNRFWSRYAAVALTSLLVLSAWVSYQHTKGIHLTPVTRTPVAPVDPTSTVLSLSATGPSSRPTDHPQPPQKPLPIDIPPIPGDPPFVLPNLGRTDLCRPWAYGGSVYPAVSDKLPAERLVYNLTTLAPLHLETVAICPTAGGANAPCTEYDDSTDAVSGKLRVVAAEIELPTIEVFLQHGSELGLEDVSLCLMKRPLTGTDRKVTREGHTWSFSISIWKDPTSVIRNNRLASLSMIITLPSAYTHNLTTRLNFFNQLIGYSSVPDFQKLSFGTLQLAGDNGRIEVWNTEARTIDGRSNDGSLSVASSRIGNSLRLSSVYGMVTCSVTLVQTEDGPPIKANLHSEAGVVEIYANLEYSLSPTALSQFDITAYSRHSRALIYITDYRGTLALQKDLLPTVLPIIRMNVTSKFAITEAVIPATFAGSVDMRSRHAEIGMIDWAKDIPGRKVEWSTQQLSLMQGTVQWGRPHSARGGSLYALTEFAAPRLLFLGLDGGMLENWPEGTEWKLQGSV